LIVQESFGTILNLPTDLTVEVRPFPSVRLVDALLRKNQIYTPGRGAPYEV